MSERDQGSMAPVNAEPLKASRTSTISSGTHVPSPEQIESRPDAIEKSKEDDVLHGGEGQSAFPEDKKVRS